MKIQVKLRLILVVMLLQEYMLSHWQILEKMVTMFDALKEFNK